jgi:hypothetical protein
MSHTPGPWRWWTSNSWKRLRHDDRGVSTDVLVPYALGDGGADCDVSNDDMPLLAAAPDLLEALQQWWWLNCHKGLNSSVRRQMKIHALNLTRDAIAKATEGAE